MLLNGLWVNPRHGRGPRDKVTALAMLGTDEVRVVNYDGNSTDSSDKNPVKIMTQME